MADQGTSGLFSPFLRKKRIAAALPYILKGTKILDFGCGTGQLASYIKPENYMGLDIDQESIDIARKQFPDHKFLSQREQTTCQDQSLRSERMFDTIVALAVIEHVDDPATWLSTLTDFLIEDQLSSIIITTPHPSFIKIHELGAKVGLFSREAHEEHHMILGKQDLIDCADNSPVFLTCYKRFLCFVNQLAIYKLRNSHV